MVYTDSGDPGSEVGQVRSLGVILTNGDIGPRSGHVTVGYTDSVDLGSEGGQVRSLWVILTSDLGPRRGQVAVGYTDSAGNLGPERSGQVRSCHTG